MFAQAITNVQRDNLPDESRNKSKADEVSSDKVEDGCHRPEFHIDWNGVMDEINYIIGLSEQCNCSNKAHTLYTRLKENISLSNILLS